MLFAPLLLALAGQAGPPVPSCPQVLAAVPGVRACAASSIGVGLADTQAAADALIADALPGEARFRSAFGQAPARYAVVEADRAAMPSIQAGLRTIGITLVLPIPSQRVPTLQRAPAAQAMAASGKPGGQVAGGQAAGGQGAAPGGVTRASLGRDFVPHELGHLWYKQLWVGAVAPAGPRYGTPAPDWLDEAAALLMESDAGAQGFRRTFADGRSKVDQRAEASPPEVPLAEFLTTVHPAFASVPAGAQTSGFFIVTDTKPSLFYPQARVLADYLIERSGDPLIFASLTRAMVGGATFADWIARDGARHRLPTTLPAMQVDWEAWLASKYGQPA